ncbi:S66 peptidase family protein [Photobacterium sp. TY1-4]|uniref:S66 family peptidase n=1 Tax=Photobacterium sp. TY1-4 TaxID=2899122 RepID=UPI0021C0667C|nr:S66 peptidase family protein [Photobacterium sp. TY1-4]UXI02623.1 LD-carboxypeptidase [Photobacterium sp. TY1-4]
MTWMNMRYPRPLAPGATIAVTAFSAGVPEACHPRLEIVLAHLRAQGFRVIEGRCLRENIMHVSAPKEIRARELMQFLCDDTIDAVMPPWGGDFAMALLPLLDFERLAAARPKWLIGFSDISTLQMVLTTRLGWATAHTANLMQLHPEEQEPLTCGVFDCLNHAAGESIVQQSSTAYQMSGELFADNPNAVLSLTEPTLWQVLGDTDTAKVQGRLIGGCLDTLCHLASTPYLDLAALHRASDEKGVLLYFENAELPPTVYLRTLLGMKYQGIFKGLNGIIIGRNAVPKAQGQDIDSDEALFQALADLPVPVIYDADIGHLPPNLTLVNGAYAQLRVEGGLATLKQTLC